MTLGRVTVLEPAMTVKVVSYALTGRIETVDADEHPVFKGPSGSSSFDLRTEVFAYLQYRLKSSLTHKTPGNTSIVLCRSMEARHTCNLPERRRQRR